MRLFRDLWVTSPRRTALVGVLIVLGAIGQSLAAAFAGPVLIDRSSVLFALLAVALVVAVGTDLVMGLITAGLTADWAADVRRRLCRVAFGQDLPTLEGTPVGELLDRMDGDVNQVAAELRGAGVRIAQAGRDRRRVDRHGVRGVVAGRARRCSSSPPCCAVALRKPTARITPARMGEEEAWSDLAAVMEESIHGQDDVRTSLARPYVLRLFARRASEVLARGRRVWSLSARVTSSAAAVMRAGIAAVVVGGVVALTAGRDRRRAAHRDLAAGAGVRRDGRAREPDGARVAVRARGLEPGPTAARGETGAHRRARAGRRRTSPCAISRSGTATSPERRPALRDVTLTFARGRSYALIGRTGSGKSTLAKVLTRAVDVPRGTVFLGDTDLLDLDLDGLRRWIAIVPQRTEILAGTLAENIALFDPDLIEPAGQALAELGLGGLGPRPARRAEHQARRRRSRAVGRAGAARRVRADPRARPARGDPRRGDRADGPGHRGAGPTGHRAVARRTHRHRRRAPVVVGAQLRRGGDARRRRGASRPGRCTSPTGSPGCSPPATYPAHEATATRAHAVTSQCEPTRPRRRNYRNHRKRARCASSTG